MWLVCTPAASCEINRVDWCLVRIEQPELLLRGVAVLLVLVEHGEHVHLHRARLPRRARAGVADQVLVVCTKEKFLGENFPRKPKILFLGGVRFFYLSPEIFGPFESPPKPNWCSQISGHPAAS